MHPSHHHFHPGHRNRPHGHHFSPRGGGRGFGHGRWGDAEEGGRGRRRRVLDSSELRLVLLKLIADQARHGYELIRAIEDLTGGAYAPSPGIVYPTLTMLQELQQIEEAASDAARKAFAITAAGREHLAARQPEVEALFARLAALAVARERSDGGPIRRAMQNLRTVLVNKLERDAVKIETVHAVAAILDDAAQRIERL